MRAAVLREIGQPLTVEEVELADPGPGEVTVRIVASGVCHSDWNVITGATPKSISATHAPIVSGYRLHFRLLARLSSSRVMSSKRECVMSTDTSNWGCSPSL